MDLYKSITTMHEYVILASADTYRSVVLAYNIWDPLSLYQNNVADADSG